MSQQLCKEKSSETWYYGFILKDRILRNHFPEGFEQGKRDFMDLLVEAQGEIMHKARSEQLDVNVVFLPYIRQGLPDEVRFIYLLKLEGPVTDEMKCAKAGELEGSVRRLRGVLHISNSNKEPKWLGRLGRFNHADADSSSDESWGEPDFGPEIVLKDDDNEAVEKDKE